MTNYAKLVIMATTYEQVEAVMARFTDPPADETQGRKYRRILDAATELFVHHGYRKTSLDDIAREAGVAKGTVYLYFRNKADLLFHAVAEEKTRYLSEIRPIFDTRLTPVKRLKTFIYQTVVLSRKMPLAAKLISGDREIQLVIEEADAGLRERGATMEVALVAEMIDAVAAPHHRSPETIEEQAAFLINLLYAELAGEQVVPQHIAVERYAKLLADTLVDGLASRADGAGQ